MGQYGSFHNSYFNFTWARIDLWANVELHQCISKLFEVSISQLIEAFIVFSCVSFLPILWKYQKCLMDKLMFAIPDLELESSDCLGC